MKKNLKDAYLATVENDVGPHSFGAKFLLVVAQQFDGLVVVESSLVVPSCRVDARQREILIGLLAEEAEEGHLDDAHRFVGDFGRSSHVRVPIFFAALFAPRDVGHLGGLQIRVDASLSQARHVAEDVNGVVRHAQVGIDPVPT